MGLYNTQEIVLSFNESIHIGSELKLIVNGLQGKQVSVISTAIVEGNNIKITLKTLPYFKPALITVKGLVDREGKTVVVENINI